MGLIIAGKVLEIEGLTIRSWADDPVLRLTTEDKRDRPLTWVRGIVLHTTRGAWPQNVLPGRGKSVDAGEKIGKYWAHDNRKAGAHIIIDHDCSISCLADLTTETAFHAGWVNDVTVGIEMYQGRDTTVYEEQLQTAAKIVNALTDIYSIQRQFQWPYNGPLKVLNPFNQGRGLVGVYGHRDVTNNRGRGDPGDAIFEMLERDYGYEAFDFSKGEDTDVWIERQYELGVLADGVPGPITAKAIRDKRNNGASGLWSHDPRAERKYTWKI